MRGVRDRQIGCGLRENDGFCDLFEKKVSIPPPPPRHIQPKLASTVHQFRHVTNPEPCRWRMSNGVE